MKTKQTLLLGTVILLLNGSIHAQNSIPARKDGTNTSTARMSTKPAAGQHHPRHYVKLNMPGLVLRNYQIQYEHVLSRKISVALSYRTMPAGSLPFKDQIIKAAVTEPEDANTLNRLKVSDFALTPEVRIYLSKKGYGRGFYIAPFYRYSSFKVQNFSLSYENDAGKDESYEVTGQIKANTGGILFGVQKSLGKRISLDWWLLGPHLGKAKGDLKGRSSEALSAAEQEDLKRQLEDIEIPFSETGVEVDANTAALRIDGPWVGIRVGLSVAVKF